MKTISKLICRHMTKILVVEYILMAIAFLFFLTNAVADIDIENTSKGSPFFYPPAVPLLYICVAVAFSLPVLVIQFLMQKTIKSQSKRQLKATILLAIISIFVFVLFILFLSKANQYSMQRNLYEMRREINN